MRVGTWNVEYAFAARLPALREILRANPADVWVLTETHDDLVPPDCPYVAHAAPRPRNSPRVRAGSRWVSIWSRFPILESDAVSTTDGERTVCALLDRGGDGHLLVYGTVMPWHSDRGRHPPDATVPNWSEHHRVVPEQCREWTELRAAHPGAMMCVAGDYNTDMGSGTRYGTKRGIEMLRRGLDESGLYCATEPGRFPEGLLAEAPIDHIALPVEWQTRASVVAAWPASKGVMSDHSGCVVEISE